MKIILIILVAVIAIAGGFFYLRRQESPLVTPPLMERQITGEINYEGTGRFKPEVTIFDNDVAQVTQVEITPDGQVMLVGTLTGRILAYQKVDGVFKRQTEPFFVLETSQPGFPPEEAGLTGIILAVDFEDTREIYLTYSYRNGPKDYRNRVSKIAFDREGQDFIGKDLTQIFESNTPGGPSHQIQDGTGTASETGKGIVFAIGEGFKPEEALDTSLNSGKVIYLATGVNFQQTAAIGVRNAPAITRGRGNSSYLLTDTGPDNNDRLIYGNFDPLNPPSLNWDGSEESLQVAAVDPITGADMVLYRWSPSETPVNVLFFKHSRLPELSMIEDYILVTLFGRTGEKENGRGRKIVLGRLTHSNQPRVTFESFIDRKETARGRPGNPLGLAIDPVTKTIYFGDILEGKIYQADIR